MIRTGQQGVLNNHTNKRGLTDAPKNLLRSNLSTLPKKGQTMTTFHTEKYTLHGYRVTINQWYDEYIGRP
jgi:hypothetical protein